MQITLVVLLVFGTVSSFVLAMPQRPDDLLEGPTTNNYRPKPNSSSELNNSQLIPLNTIRIYIELKFYNAFLVCLARCNPRIRDVVISFPEEGVVCRCGHRPPTMIRHPNPFSQIRWTCKKTGTISTSTTTSLSKSTTAGETREEGRSDLGI
jgi:hypothetical protein